MARKGSNFSCSYSNYAKCLDTRRSITRCRIFLNGSSVIFRSSIQKTISLTMTEDEGTAGVMCTQDMLYAMEVIKSLGLDVQKLMVLEMDNKGAVDLANN